MKKYDNTESKASCSLLGIIAILVIVFILLLGGVIYLKTKIKVPDITKKNTSENLNKSVSEQLNSQSGEKIVNIRVTESDLSSAINTNSADFPLKKASVKITPDKIILSGKTSDGPFSFKLDVGIVPKVKDEKVVFDIEEIKTSGVSAPKIVTDEVNKKLSNYLSQQNLNNEIKVTDVKLYQSYLIVTGERKK
ncbi:MAG: hypothetical protein M1324_01080 [Patescibacteria group bacterium]|nr:hypothetical protein [Patescibacteria group bacterium]